MFKADRRWQAPCRYTLSYTSLSISKGRNRFLVVSMSLAQRDSNKC